MKKRKFLASTVMSMVIFANSLPIIHASEVSNEKNLEGNNYEITVRNEINLDDKVNLFISTQESLPEGILVDTEIISENHAIQHLKDNNRQTEEFVEIKLESQGIVIDYYDSEYIPSSKVETQIVPIENFKHLDSEPSTLGNETGGSYDWNYGSTAYKDTTLNGKHALSSLRNSAKSYLLSFVPYYNTVSTIQSAANTMADYAYKAQATTYYSTKRVKYWRQARPTEANNTYKRPYLHSHEYEIESWSHGQSPRIIKRWQELFYANSY